MRYAAFRPRRCWVLSRERGDELGSLKRIAMFWSGLEYCLLCRGQVSRVLKQKLLASRSAKAQPLATCFYLSCLTLPQVMGSPPHSQTDTPGAPTVFVTPEVSHTELAHQLASQVW